MAFAEDLSQFFDTDDFAVEALINTVPPRTIKVIFETPTQAVELYDSSIQGDAPRLQCKTSDLIGVKKGMTATIGGTGHKIEKQFDDGIGVSFLYLS